MSGFGKTILCLFCSALFWSAGAVECIVLPSFARNVDDQFVHILPNRPPMIPLVKEVAANETFTVNVLFRNFRSEYDHADVFYRLVLKKPDGKEQVLCADLPGVPGIRKPPGSDVYLAGRLARFAFTGEDQPGKYRFIATADDRIAKKQAAAEATVEYVRGRKAAPPLTEKELDRFLMNDYLHPEPARLMDMIGLLLKQDMNLRKTKKNYSPLPMLYGFTVILRDNPELTGAFASCISAAPPEQRGYAIPVFDLLGKDALEKAGNKLAPDLRKAVSDFDPKKNPLRFASPETPVQLDMLWWDFFLTGKFEPILKIAAALELGKDGITPQAYKQLGAGATPADRLRLRNKIMELAAGWSLMSNARTHRLVFYYLEALAKRDGRLLPGEYARTCVRAIVHTIETAPQEKKPQAK